MRKEKLAFLVHLSITKINKSLFPFLSTYQPIDEKNVQVIKSVALHRKKRRRASSLNWQIARSPL